MRYEEAVMTISRNARWNIPVALVVIDSSIELTAGEREAVQSLLWDRMTDSARKFDIGYETTTGRAVIRVTNIGRTLVAGEVVFKGDVTRKKRGCDKVLFTAGIKKVYTREERRSLRSSRRHR